MEDYESQFKGSIIAEAMGAVYQTTKEFYLEYPLSDYNFGHAIRIAPFLKALPLDRTVAHTLLKASPYCELLSNYMYGNRDNPYWYIMNKGAVRLSREENSLWLYNGDGKYYLIKREV